MHSATLPVAGGTRAHGEGRDSELLGMPVWGLWLTTDPDMYLG